MLNLVENEMKSFEGLSVSLFLSVSVSVSLRHTHKKAKLAFFLLVQYLGSNYKDCDLCMYVNIL